MLPYIPLFIAVFLVALVGTAIVRRLARRYGWIATPRADRWHAVPTALHGGLGFCPIFIGTACCLLLVKFGVVWSQEAPDAAAQPWLAFALLAGAALMFCVGLWDDIKPLRPATKLLCQLVAASLFVYMGGGFTLTHVYVLDLLLTYMWFVGITNAVNMLDNMDGLSSGVVMLAGLTLVVLALQAPGEVLAIPLGITFVAALLGFWVHNRPPAAIFMGDSGSLCIGYTLAGLAVPSALNGFLGIHAGGPMFGPALALLIPATVLAIPIFDTTLVTLTRTWRAQKASQGGRDHSSHRLVGLGLSEKKAVWLLYSYAAFGGAVAVVMQRFPEQSLPLFGVFGLMLVLTGVYLGRVKVQTADADRLPPVWTPLVSNLLYKRHAAEVLFDTMLVVICLYGAYLLRYEGTIPPVTMRAFTAALPLTVASCLVVFLLMGIYRGRWRLISVADVPCYVIGVVGGTLLSFGVITLISPFANELSRSAQVVFGLLLLLGMVGTRLSFRLLDALFVWHRAAGASSPRQPVLIYGAGRGGKLLHEEVTSNPEMQSYAVIGFIDDDLQQTGRSLCGVPVKNGNAWLRHQWPMPPEIWISSRSVPDARARRMAERWREHVAVRRFRIHIDPLQDQTLVSVPDVVPPYTKHNHGVFDGSP